MFGKVIAMFLDKFIVHTLANNKQFQRLALRIDDIVTKKKSVIQAKISDIRDGSMNLTNSDIFSGIKDRWESIKKQ